MSIRARVHQGKLVVDEPTDLPEGTVLDLVVDDESDDLNDEERRALHAHLDKALIPVREGKGRPAAAVIADLRARR
jgi:hypothetical protein